MWPFSKKLDPNRIEMRLHYWGGPGDPTYTLHLAVGGHEVLESVGQIIGKDFRVNNIVTVPMYRRQGYGTLAIGTLIAAARARGCNTFTLENVSPKNVEAVNLYRRYGAVVLSPAEPGGHSDHQITL
jgi:ribosomal protein S18 acetylase RimI-like enzyme